MAASRSKLMRAVARDLTALHDPDLILTGLAKRVRAALKCDLAYVSLNDPRTRETRIRFSDGVRTPAYADIRMPIGTGVLGMAAAGVTTESPDYLPDLAKFHIEAIDEAVKGEGVRAILGTPLRAGGEVVGALTVANRVPGGFSGEQKLLLEEAALIGSAAVEIYLLRRRLEDQEEVFAKEATRLSAESVDAAHRLRLSTELSASLAAGHGTPELLAIASKSVRGSVWISEEPAARSDGSGRPSILVPLEVGGSLELAGEHPEVLSNLAPTIATFVSTAMLYERAIEDARHFRESELVERLVDPPPHQSGWPLRTGLGGSGDLVLIVMEFEDANSLRAALAAVRSAMGSLAITASRRGSLVAIARGNAGAVERIAATIAKYPYFAGVATAPSDAGIAEAFSEASLVARSMRTLRRSNELAARSELGVVAFAVGAATDSAERYISAHLGPLLRPTPRDRALLQTALHYLDSQGSVAAVASGLAIHENTVRQRLERLDELLVGWRSGPRSLDVHVALRAQALIDAG